MTRGATRPGPRPENQRKRTELRGPRNTLIGVLAIVAVLAAIAAVDAFGTPRLGMESSALGRALLVAVAITQAIAAVVLVARAPRARMIALAAALLALAWGVAQIVGLDQVGWLPLSLLAVGALESLLVAGCTPRAA